MSDTKLWRETIKELYGCVPDINGNMPCDYGAPCDLCSSTTADKAFKAKLEQRAKEDEKMMNILYLSCCSAVFGPVDPEFDGDVEDYYDIRYDMANQETVDYFHSMLNEMIEHMHDDDKE